jgi:hypothetical protein
MAVRGAADSLVRTGCIGPNASRLMFRHCTEWDRRRILPRTLQTMTGRHYKRFLEALNAVCGAAQCFSSGVVHEVGFVVGRIGLGVVAGGERGEK